jgi:hypothetical protein
VPSWIRSRNGTPRPAVALRDRHDQAQVRLDHAALRALVAALDRLREDDLLVGGEQLVAADVGEEELQAVGRASDLVDLEVDLRLRRLLLLLVYERRPDFETDRLELAVNCSISSSARSCSSTKASKSTSSM